MRSVKILLFFVAGVTTVLSGMDSMLHTMVVDKHHDVFETLLTVSKNKEKHVQDLWKKREEPLKIITEDVTYNCSSTFDYIWATANVKCMDVIFKLGLLPRTSAAYYLSLECDIPEQLKSFFNKLVTEQLYDAVKNNDFDVFKQLLIESPYKKVYRKAVWENFEVPFKIVIENSSYKILCPFDDMWANGRIKMLNILRELKILSIERLAACFEGETPRVPMPQAVREFFIPFVRQFKIKELCMCHESLEN